MGAPSVLSSHGRYQLADWRLRPLPADMLHYARADTHFLLAAADALRGELAAAGSRLAEGWAVPVPPHSGAGQVRLHWRWLKLHMHGCCCCCATA